jgi:hypothetical protein
MRRWRALGAGRVRSAEPRRDGAPESRLRATRDLGEYCSHAGQPGCAAEEDLTLLRISSSFTGTQEYIFKHALLHQVGLR